MSKKTKNLSRTTKLPWLQPSQVAGQITWRPLWIVDLARAVLRLLTGPIFPTTSKDWGSILDLCRINTKLLLVRLGFFMCVIFIGWGPSSLLSYTPRQMCPDFQKIIDRKLTRLVVEICTSFPCIETHTFLNLVYLLKWLKELFKMEFPIFL